MMHQKDLVMMRTAHMLMPVTSPSLMAAASMLIKNGGGGGGGGEGGAYLNYSRDNGAKYADVMYFTRAIYCS